VNGSIFRNCISGFQIRSEEKSVHIMPEILQGVEHSRKHAMSPASREVAASSTLDQSSAEIYPSSKQLSVLSTRPRLQNTVLQTHKFLDSSNTGDHGYLIYKGRQAYFIMSVYTSACLSLLTSLEPIHRFSRKLVRKL